MAIQIRRGTDSEWESNKSNIVAGEPAVAMDSERMFVGTGSGTYMELANIEAIADAFDASASYDVGDYVSYQGAVYKFTSAHSGAWDVDDVEKASLAEFTHDATATDTTLSISGAPADAKATGDAIALKADASTSYTKSDVDSALALKADKSDTYTKAQVDNALNGKADNNELDSIDNDLTSTFYQNLFSPKNSMLGGYFGSNGNITAQASSAYTPNFIPVDNTKTYKATSASPYQMQVCTYNANKEFIERAYNTTDYSSFTFGSNVAYVKISLYSIAFPNGFIFTDSVSWDYLKNPNGMVIKETSLPPLQITPSDTTFLEPKYESVPISSLNNVIYKENTNCYPGSGGLTMLLNPQTGYSSYIISITKPTILYVTGSVESGNYRSISVLRQVTGIKTTYYEGSDGVRYRDSDNNLPTAENPIVLNAGDAVFFTTISGFNVMTNYNRDIYEFEELSVDAEQISGIVGKGQFIKYTSTGDVQNNTEYLDIFLPVKNNYVLYRLAHYVKPSINADSWHMYFIYACDKDFNIIENVTTTGEMECAIALSGRPDFSGGSAHGDEVATEFHVFVDGQVVEPSSLSALTEFNSLRIVEVTNLYDPNDSTTIFAKHGREYVFDEDGLTINQRIDWLLNETTTVSYLAMFTPAKTVTDHIYTDSDYSVYEIITDPNTGYIVSKTWNKTKKAVIYGEDSGVTGICEILDYPSFDNTALNLRDNNGGDYNKLYFNIAGTNVSAGDVWIAKSHFKFELTVE